MAAPATLRRLTIAAALAASLGCAAPAPATDGADAAATDTAATDSAADATGDDTDAIFDASIDAAADTAGVDATGVEAGGADGPDADSPGADAATTDTPALDTPTIDTPTIDTPTIDTPAFDTPASDNVAIEDTPTDTPTTDTPTTDTPTTDTTTPTDAAADVPAPANPDPSYPPFPPAASLPLDGEKPWSPTAPQPQPAGLPGCSGGFVPLSPLPLPLPPTPSDAQGPTAPGPHSGGLIADLDSDGDNELLLWGEGGALRLYESQGGALPASATAKLQVGGNDSPRLGGAVRLVVAGEVRALVIGHQQAWWLRKQAGVWGTLLAGDFTEAKPTLSRTATVADVDNDGLLDVVVVAAACNGPVPPLVLLQRPDGVFVDVAKASGLAIPAAYWQALAHDADGDGDIDLALLADGCGGGSAQVFARQVGRDAVGAPLWQRQAPHPLFAFPKAKMPQASPMGAVAGDLDGDAHLDVVIANVGYPMAAAAMVKLAPPEMLPWAWLVRSLALRGRPDGALVDAGELLGVAGLVDPVKGMHLIAWGAGLYDLDRDRWPDLLLAHGTHYDAAMLDTHGPMRPVALHNRGGQLWADLGAALNLPANWSGHALALGDLDGDGDADVVLGGDGGPPLLLRNDIVHGRHYLRLRLVGRVSNALGVGARVVVSVGGVSRYVAVGADGPFGGQHEQVADFGLGAATVADVAVHWPSGVVQQLSAVAADQQLTVLEPEVVNLSSRIVAKGGSVALSVQPHDATGQPVAAAVSVEAFPPGAVEGLAGLTCDAAGACGATVTRSAGAKAGTLVRLRVTIAGAALTTWPALWLP